MQKITFLLYSWVVLFSDIFTQLDQIKKVLNKHCHLAYSCKLTMLGHLLIKHSLANSTLIWYLHSFATSTNVALWTEIEQKGVIFLIFREHMGLHYQTMIWKWQMIMIWNDMKTMIWKWQITKWCTTLRTFHMIDQKYIK